MSELDVNMQKTFEKIFQPIPHVDELPCEPLARITLKDAEKIVKTKNYACPCKWKDAWYVLLQQHLAIPGTPTGSVAFIIPKADPAVLPWWVNDHHQLNANTVMDSFPIPWINDILADCAKGKIWATLDMTDSFFLNQDVP